MGFQRNSGFNLRRIERLQRRNAETVNWQRASKCPCGQKPNWAASITRTSYTCGLCFGFGYLYDPVIPILALVSAYQVRRDPVEVAVATPGDLTLSPLPRQGVWVNDYDLFSLPNWEEGEPYGGEFITRAAAGQTDEVRYPIRVPGTATVVIEPGVRTDYQPGTDFTTSERALTWLAGHGPLPGTVYSLRYQPRFYWIAFNSPFPRYARGVDLGQRVLLKRRDLIVQETPTS